MKKTANIRKRIIKSVKRHGLKNFYRIAKLRIKTAIEINPEFANYYELPNSELVLEKKTAVQPSLPIVAEPVLEIANEILPEIKPIVVADPGNTFTKQPLFPDNVVVIFSGVPFDDVGGGQRPAQFARVLLSQGKKVIYIYAYLKYDFALNIHVKSDLQIPNMEHIYIEDVSPEDLMMKFRKNTDVIFEFPHKNFLPYARKCWTLGINTTFDLIDEWDTSLGGDWYSEAIMQEFVDKCTTVCGSAKLLRDKLVTMGRKDALYIPNAANEQIFDIYKTFNQPPVEYLNNDRKKCLYFGSLYGEWFGWDYLIEAANGNKDVDFFLIGDYGNQKVLPANVYPIGARNIDDLPAYLYFADAALLPFVPGKISDAVSPIKIFEYLFMGKPVVATYLPEIVDYPNVFIGKDPKHYASLVKKAIEAGKGNNGAIESFISTHSWAHRLQNLIPAKAKPCFSAIILIRNNEKIIRRCLASLVANGANYLKEIIVVDNDSTDNGPKIVAKEFPQVTLLRNNKNGCSSGRNLGISKATGDYIVFFDSDQWITSEACFEEAISILDRHPFIGAAGWGAGWIDRTTENYGGMIMDYLPKRGMLPETYFRTDIGYLGTCGFFLKRSVLEKTQKFDEFYDPTCFEDTDLCFQVLDLGYQVAYRDFTGVRHQPHQTTNASSGSDAYNTLFRRNADHFKNKWDSKTHLFLDYKGF